ncbi:thiol reductant ABC exporter subunit CydD [Halorhodospira halochloris]|uniref:thiol reductant ABC exporter subunit CydD n=1 Tax=Halorhodospira halochloris TaxID=1052 RepID=UPI001EE8494C|nr:thiol reductant ABC exporter subunit CydD [Halorhodospira halochloris]MCG5547211.1 thiol reductant ABC exporter subunit CydD [Halorhodospira halochloris]
MSDLEQQHSESNDVSPARWLNAQAKGARGAFAISIGMGLVDAVLIVAQALLIAWIANGALITKQPLEDMLPAFAGLGAVFVLRAVCTWARAAAGAWSAKTITAAVRRRLYRRIAALGPARLQGYHSGQVASALVEQVEALEGYYANYLPQMVLATIIPLGLIAVVFVLDVIAGLLLLLAAPLVPLFMALIGMKAERRSQEQQQSISRISAHFLDRLRGLGTLRIFRATERAAADVEQAAEDYRARSMGVLKVAFLSSAALELISAVSIALVAIYIGFSLLGFLDFGPGPELGLLSGLAILILAPEVFQPLRRFAVHYHDRATAIGAAEQITQLLAEPLPANVLAEDAPRSQYLKPLEHDPDSGLPQPQPVALSFDRVSVRFHRGGTSAGLQDLDLKISAGEKVVISGPSGAGKSTLLHLAAGFLEPDQGAVRIDGQLPPGAGGVAWVGQRPWLFHGTVRENLTLAAPQAQERTLWAALEYADLAEVVRSMPEGMATPLGEEGHGLSGGQASRLALARALLAGAPLLLLDEPTAGLDPDSAQRVLKALERLADGKRSIVMVAHDAAAQRWGERQLVIEQGRLVEDRRA